MAPRSPEASVVVWGSPAMSRVFVTRVPTLPGWPVRGMSSPRSASWLRMWSGVSPWGTCHSISPRVMSMALMMP